MGSEAGLGVSDIGPPYPSYRPPLFVNLRSRLIRLAYTTPEIRSDLIPLLRTGRYTQQTDRFGDALEAMETELIKVLPWGRRRRLGAGGDQLARKVAQTAKVVLAFLDLRFQDPERRKQYRLRRWTNFKKMVTAFSKVKDDAELVALAESMDTKSKDAYDKYRDLRKWVMGVVQALDVEVEATIDAGPWAIRLMTVPRVDWSNDAASRLKWVADEATKVLNAKGVGKAAGGKMHAWPSESVPMSGRGRSGVLASYNPSHDLTRVAAGGNARQILNTLIHELGHRYYFKVMGGRGRQEWEKFFGAHVGKPDLDWIMREWETFAHENTFFGRWSPHFARYLKDTGNQDQLMWLQIAASAIGLKEEFHPLTGEPRRTKKNRPGLDVVREALPKLEVFLHPVTAYSTVSAEELFAETFAHIVTHGPRRIPPIVRHAFRQAVPNARVASERMTK